MFDNMIWGGGQEASGLIKTCFSAEKFQELFSSYYWHELFSRGNAGVLTFGGKQEILHYNILSV